MAASKGVSVDPNSEEFKQFPNRLVEDQDMEMQPVVVGTPPFSSPDPETDGLRMHPLTEGSSATDGELVPEGLATASDPDNMKAKDFINLANSAQTHEDLDGVEELHKESGKDFSTVHDAIEKRREDIDAAEDQ